MIDFKNVTKIITHSGHAHRDDFLSVCFVLAMCSEHQNMPSVYRRDPTESELNDPNVVVIDIGERHEPHLSNFDHHQFDRNHEPCCALSLILKDMTIYNEAVRAFRWLKPTEKFDSKGPYEVAKDVGVEWSAISDYTFSPVEETMLHLFGKSFENAQNPIYLGILATLGLELLKTLELFTQRWKQLDESVSIIDVNGNQIVLSLKIDGANDPIFALSAFVDEKYPTAIATVTHDDRGDGLCLYRVNDSPLIDYSAIENDEKVLFAHKNGFVAKTHKVLNTNEITELIEKSLK